MVGMCTRLVISWSLFLVAVGTLYFNLEAHKSCALISDVLMAVACGRDSFVYTTTVVVE